MNKNQGICALEYAGSNVREWYGYEVSIIENYCRTIMLD